MAFRTGNLSMFSIQLKRSLIMIKTAGLPVVVIVASQTN